MLKRIFMICIFGLNLFQDSFGLPIFDDGTGRRNYYGLIKQYHEAVNIEEFDEAKKILGDLENEIYDPLAWGEDQRDPKDEVYKLAYLVNFLTNEGFYNQRAILKRYGDLKDLKNKYIERAKEKKAKEEHGKILKIKEKEEEASGTGGELLTQDMLDLIKSNDDIRQRNSKLERNIKYCKEKIAKLKKHEKERA